MPSRSFSSTRHSRFLLLTSFVLALTFVVHISSANLLVEIDSTDPIQKIEDDLYRLDPVEPSFPEGQDPFANGFVTNDYYEEPPKKNVGVRCTRLKHYQYSTNGKVNRESYLAHSQLDNMCGLEIGASACTPFGLNTIHVGLSASMDKDDYTRYASYQKETCGAVAPIDLPRHADQLDGISNSTYEFILHSHVWEHVPNPLRALDEWVRVIMDGGLLYIIVPKRDISMSDRSRPLTKITDLVALYDQNVTSCNMMSAWKDKEELLHRDHHTIFSKQLLLQIMMWFNKKNYPQVGLSLVSLMETDDVDGSGHQITWRVHKDIFEGLTEESFFFWQ